MEAIYELSVCPVMVKGTVAELRTFPVKENVNKLSLFPVGTAVQPPEVAASSTEPPEVSVVPTYEHLSFSEPVKVFLELTVCPAMTKKADHELLNYTVIFKEAVSELFACPVMARKAVSDLFICPVTGKETVSELPACPVTARKAAPDLSFCPEPTTEVIHEVVSCLDPTIKTILELSTPPVAATKTVN